MANDLDGRRPTATVMVLFSLIMVLIGWDLVTDFSRGIGWLHLATESAVLLVAGVGFGLLWRQLAATRSGLAAVTAQADAWKRENEALLRGLSRAIHEQFERWELTEAEGQVALLMLKGLSHKEIARLRSTSDRTIREQARAVYRKSGLAGRAELSAFFLEDLLLPEEMRESAPQRGTGAEASGASETSRDDGASSRSRL